jgi:CMP-N-acetylneuraminic acid synthetase
MKLVLLTLARAGSKRIKNKNKVMYGGIKLFEYTCNIMEGLSRELDCEAYIATDDQEIKDEVIWKYDRIKAIEKPERYAQDIHLTNEEIKYYNERMNADIFVLFQITSPLRNYDKIKTFIEAFIAGKYDCSIPVKEQSAGFYYTKNQKLYNIDGRNYNSSEKTPVFKETGNFYCFKKEMLDKNHITNSNNYCLFYDDFGIDIDSLSDLEECEFGIEQQVEVEK